MWTAFRLNALIVRFRLGLVKDLVRRISVLSPQVPLTVGISCLGLAIASAHKTGDLSAARDLACSLARGVQSDWDLPTLPKLYLGVGKRLIVLEAASVAPMLEIIENLKANCQLTGEQRSLLAALAERYRCRLAA